MIETSAPPPRVTRFGVFELDLHTRELRKAGVRLRLPAQSVEVLTLLLERSGDLVTREELRERLWPAGTFVDFDHGLNASVNRLREALGDAADRPRFIETVPRRGYRFIGPIEGPRATLTPPLTVGASQPRGAAPRRPAWMGWTIAAIFGVALVATALRFSSTRLPPPSVPARFDETLPDNMDVYHQAELSPDGRRLVFTGSLNGRPQLFIRDVGSTAVVGLDQTENALFPFWSPDSGSIAFFATGKLKRIAVTGGSPRVLTDAKGWNRLGAGSGTWAEGTILFALSDGSIVRVPDTGGTATPVGSLRGNPAVRARWPRFLPDGRHFVFSTQGDLGLRVASLDSPGSQPLAENGSRAVYAGGRLIYLRATSVFVRLFDAAARAFTGPEIEIAKEVAFFSASENGTIVFKPDRTDVSRLTWFDRHGSRTGVLGEPGPYLQVVLSARGERGTLVRAPRRSIEANWDLWDVNLTTGIASRLTTDSALDSDASWSPDDRRVAFTSSRNGAWGVFVKDVIDGTETPLIEWKESVMVDQWTPDGQFIIFHNTRGTVWAVSASGGAPRMLVDTPFQKDEIHVSPDGRWVAYNGDESGRWEAYVAAFPTFSSQRQISSTGGVQPQWSADGRELFYLRLDGSIMSVRMTAGRRDLIPSTASFLFSTHFDPTPSQPQYAVSRDGQRFLGLEQVQRRRHTLTFLVNWFDANSPRTLAQ